MLTKSKQLSDKLEAARKVGDVLQTADIHMEIAMLSIAENDYANAMEHFEKAELAVRQPSNLRKRCQVLNQKAVAQLITGHHQNARDSLQLALDLARDLNDYLLTSSFYGNLGRVYSTMGNQIRAVKCFKAMHEIALDKEDRDLQLQALINLADGYLQERSLQQALGFGLVGLDLAQDLSSRPGLMIIHDVLGMIYARKREFTTAVEHHHQSALAAEELGDLPRLGASLANKALALEALTRMREAEQSMQIALEVFQALGSPHVQKTRRDLARIRQSLPGARTGMD